MKKYIIMSTICLVLGALAFSPCAKAMDPSQASYFAASSAIREGELIRNYLNQIQSEMTDGQVAIQDAFPRSLAAKGDSCEDEE